MESAKKIYTSAKIIKEGIEKAIKQYNIFFRLWEKKTTVSVKAVNALWHYSKAMKKVIEELWVAWEEFKNDSYIKLLDSMESVYTLKQENSITLIDSFWIEKKLTNKAFIKWLRNDLLLTANKFEIEEWNKDIITKLDNARRIIIWYSRSIKFTNRIPASGLNSLVSLIWEMKKIIILLNKRNIKVSSKMLKFMSYESEIMKKYDAKTENRKAHQIKIKNSCTLIIMLWEKPKLDGKKNTQTILMHMTRQKEFKIHSQRMQ